MSQRFTARRVVAVVATIGALGALAVQTRSDAIDDVATDPSAAPTEPTASTVAPESTVAPDSTVAPETTVAPDSTLVTDTTGAEITEVPQVLGPPPVVEIVVEIDAEVVSFANLNATFGTTVVDVLTGIDDIALLRAPYGTDGAALALALRAVPGVVFADSNDAVEPPEVSADRIYRWSESAPSDAVEPYATALLGLDAAHLVSRGGGVVVAVVDSGVQLDPAPHPDLAEVLVPGFDFVDGDAHPDDVGDGRDNNGNGVADEGVGHGTHVAGIIHQVAPAASIMPIRVLDSDGGADEWATAKGALYAADHGAQIVNLSLGRSGSATVLMRVADELRRRGVFAVAAAGNEGRELRQRPAAARCVLAVVSTGRSETVSPFSSYGTWADVGAPGESIVSSFPGSTHVTWDGTSMATPFAAGQAALLKALDPTLSVGALLGYIKTTTVPYAVPAYRAGMGRIDPVASLQAVQSATPLVVDENVVDDRCFELDYDDND